MCEQILVTRDAVLIQPSGDPVSSGLLLLWLHHSYLPVILLCDTTQPRHSHTSKRTARGSGFLVLELGVHIVSGHDTCLYARVAHASSADMSAARGYSRPIGGSL